MTTASQPITAPLAHADTLVLDYLAALWAATDDLEPELRDELMTTVADYVAARRVLDPDADPSSLLQRLGPPGELADAARRGRIPAHLRLPVHVPAPPVPAPVAAPPRGDRGAGATEYVALALLTAGPMFLPGVAPLAGTVLAAASPRWSPAQKTVAAVLTGGSLLLAMLVFFAGVTSGFGFEALVFSYVIGVIGSCLSAVALVPGLSRRHRDA